MAIKDEMDALGRSAAGSAIVGQIFPEWRGHGSLDPHSFAAQVIPFYWYARSKNRLTASLLVTWPLYRRRQLLATAGVGRPHT